MLTGAGIGGKLMDRCKLDLRVARDNRFCPVAVMRIKIPDGNALRPVRERVEGGDGNVTEITKSHRLIARGMVSWRTHQTESRISVQRLARNICGRARRLCGMIVNTRIRGGIEIEVFHRRADVRKMLARVRA